MPAEPSLEVRALLLNRPLNKVLMEAPTLDFFLGGTPSPPGD
jgi:hypothetical protein